VDKSFALQSAGRLVKFKVTMFDFFNQHWRSGLEIIFLWIAVYQVYRSFRATRGARILLAILTLLVAITILTYLFDLRVIGYIVTRSALFIVFSLIVIFQPEIRSVLAKLGSSQFFMLNRYRRVEFMESFIETVTELSNKRIGALFAMERYISLKEFRETGVEVDAEFSKELAMTIFFPKTALHDGGMVIADRRIAAAGCVFPVSNWSDRSY
jgi:diadenylate cyclase